MLRELRSHAHGIPAPAGNFGRAPAVPKIYLYDLTLASVCRLRLLQEIYSRRLCQDR